MAKNDAGNVAVMRDALLELVKFACDSCNERFCEDDVEEEDGIRHCSPCNAIIKARSAIAAPPRNCDVGTAEEQHVRFVSYCDSCDCHMGCDHRKNFFGVLNPECSSILKCFARWEQMPYDAEGEDKC